MDRDAGKQGKKPDLAAGRVDSIGALDQAPGIDRRADQARPGWNSRAAARPDNHEPNRLRSAQRGLH